MDNKKRSRESKTLRRQIAWESARLLAEGRETDYTTAKRRAARHLGIRFRWSDFPSTREIREALSHFHQGSQSSDWTPDDRQMRLHALRMMQRLRAFTPKLTGPLTESSATTGLEIAISLQDTDVSSVREALPDVPFFEVEPSDSSIGGGLLVADLDYPIKIRIRSSTNPEAETGWTEGRLREDLERSPSDLDLELQGLDPGEDRFEVLADVLAQLERVRLDPHDHGEADALHHALQLFDLVLQERPYDEDLLTAALCHDVGRISQPHDPTHDTHSILGRLVTKRCLQLIAGLELADLPIVSTRAVVAGASGVENAEDVYLLLDLDKKARQQGVKTSTLDEAVDQLRRLEQEDWW